MAKLTLGQLDRQVTDLCLEYTGSHRFERSLFIPAAANLAELAWRAERLKAEVADAGGDRLWQEHLLEVLDVLTFRLDEDQRYPDRFLGALLGDIDDLTALDPRSAEERAAVLGAKLEQAPVLFPVLLEMLARVGPDRLAHMQEVAGSLQTVVDATRAAWAADPGITNRLDALSGDLAAFVRALEAGVERDQLLEDLPLDVTLRRGYGVDLDELLSWVDEEIGRQQAELLALAEQIGPGRTPFRILEEDLGPYPSPDEMFEPMRQYVQMAREASRAYIDLPEGEECAVADVPDNLKRSYPWGGYSPSNPLTGSLQGRVFLNSANYTAVTRGWLEMMAIHECYPGHHAHWVKTAASSLPESFKVGSLRMAKATPLIEGIAHRSEELFKHLFPDPAYPIFVKLRQLHTAVRIKAEIALHHLKRPRQEAVDLYVKYLGFSQQSADGQVRYSEAWPGYFCCYYYGHRLLEKLKAKYQAADPAFTNLTFSCGFVSLETLERLLAMAPDDRAQYLNGKAFGV